MDTSLVVVEEDTYFAADWGTYFVVGGGNRRVRASPSSQGNALCFLVLFENSIHERPEWTKTKDRRTSDVPGVKWGGGVRVECKDIGEEENEVV